MSEIKITLTKSLSGRTKRQIATVKSLGLGKVGSSNTQPDNGATMGKIRQISHMIEVERVERTENTSN